MTWEDVFELKSQEEDVEISALTDEFNSDTSEGLDA